jgi:hypothetical protein
MLIEISPDENSGDTGTTAGGVIERDLNIKVATALQTALQRCGQNVNFDPTITYVQRVAKVNAEHADLLVACAHNAASSPAAEGAMFVFAPGGLSYGKQYLAAENVGAALIAAGLVGRWTTYVENVYECTANCDVCYIEFAYQTNADDLASITRADYPQRAAEAVAQGLAKTYGFTYISPVAVLRMSNPNGETLRNDPIAQEPGVGAVIPYGTPLTRLGGPPNFETTHWIDVRVPDGRTGWVLKSNMATF